MLTFRYAKQTRSYLYPFPHRFFFFYSTAASSPPPHLSLPSYPSLLSPASSSSSSPASILDLDNEKLKEVVLPFKQWFLSRNNAFLDRIFEILRTQDGPALDAGLCRVNLRLTEGLVLEVFNYGNSKRKDVLSCLKFFDWAGRQNGFFHTRTTFHAIFKILSKAKLMALMLEFLDKYSQYVHQVRFYDTLVIGYSVAGKLEMALQVFGRMRFHGIDLHPYAYHVLLNSLVEEGNFDVADMVADQIRLQGAKNEMTDVIMVKSFCRQKNFDRAEEYLRSLMVEVENVNPGGLSGVLVGTVVDALCKDKQLERACMLVEDMRKLGKVSMEQAYGAWIRHLTGAGNLDEALDFLRSKKDADGYIPDVFRYNSLVCRLLRENRLEEVFDLLTEMIEKGIVPDEVSLSATLCFFCKSGMVDAAMELYNSTTEFGFSVNSMAYNYLINTLFGDISVDEAYRVLKDAIERGYFPGKKTFSIITDAVCREQRLDKMMELVLAALDKNLISDNEIYDKLISALCRSKKVEDAYLVLAQLNRLNKVPGKSTYLNLIKSFYKAGRGDIAASLLIEMQEKCHKPNRQLFRDVLCCLCEMNDADEQIFRLLELQLSRNEVTCDIYNFFIDGTGHGRKPHLARQIYEIMQRSGIAPNLSSDILMLQSYLKGDKIADGLCFFHDLAKRRKIGRKIWNTMIVGLCKANKPEYALEIFQDMRDRQLKPSIECYEALVKVLCDHKQYYVAIEIIDDLKEVGRRVTSFTGNILLLHTLYSRELFNAWYNSRNLQNLTPHSLMLGKLIDAFSYSIKGEEDAKSMEELIHQCFPLDLYTHNLLLRKLVMSQTNYALEYFNQLRGKGHEPNRWSYDIVVHGLLKSGRVAEARGLMEEMNRRSFDLTESTKQFYLA